MEYYGNNDWRDYHLAHYGVKGMKWGRHDKARTPWWENAGRVIGNGASAVAGVFYRKKTPEIYKPHTVRDGREITKEETASRKKKVEKAFKRLIDGARKSIKRFGSDLRKEGRRTVKAFNKEIKSSKKTLNKDKNAITKGFKSFTSSVKKDLKKSGKNFDRGVKKSQKALKKGASKSKRSANRLFRRSAKTLKKMLR